jgi:hypothetical protein
MQGSRACQPISGRVCLAACPRPDKGLIGREAEAAGQWPGRDPGSWGTPPPAAAARLAQGMNLKHDPLSHAHWASPSAQPETPSGQPRVTFNPRSGRFHWPSERRLKPRPSSQVQAHQSHILTRKNGRDEPGVGSGRPGITPCSMRLQTWDGMGFVSLSQRPLTTKPRNPKCYHLESRTLQDHLGSHSCPRRQRLERSCQKQKHRRHRFNSGELRRFQNSCSVLFTGDGGVSLRY